VIKSNCRDVPAARPHERLARFVGFQVVLSAVLLAGMPAGPALAAPQAGFPSAQAPDERGLLGSVADRVVGVADRGTELMDQVRDRATGLVDAAINFLGVRYKRGGTTAESGFDCSGFTRYVFENSIGRVLPHTAGEQANAPDLVKVDKKDLRPGDLVFFDTVRRTFSHVGIYLGDGKFIHSPRSGQSVRIEDINITYWARHFTGARRAPELAAPVNESAFAKLASQAARVAPGGNGSGDALLLATGSQAPNPASLLVGSTLPAAPEAVVAGFAPRHEPFARPLAVN
jgi:hypothetical protein